MESRVGDAGQRLAPEQDYEHDGESARHHHLRLMLIGTTIAMAIFVTAVTISQRDEHDVGGSPGSSLSPGDLIRQLYRGLPQHGTTLGKRDAPLLMVQFLDPQCVYCGEYARELLPEIVNNYVRTGSLRLELRPLTFAGRDSVVGARAAVGAAAQDRLYEFIDFFYLRQGAENSGYVTDDFLRGVAHSAGATPASVLSNAHSNRNPPLVARAATEARRHGITTTPDFLIRLRDGPMRHLKLRVMNREEFFFRFNNELAR